MTRHVAFCLHVHHIPYLGVNSLADSIVGTQQTFLVGNLGNILVQFHAVVHHGTNLQHIEFASLVGMQIYRKLNFYRSLHLVLSVFEYFLHNFRQREYIVFQYTGKRDNLAVLAFVVSVIDTLIIGIEGRGNPLEGTILLRFANRNLNQIKTVVHFEFLIAFLFLGSEGKETGLCISERYFHLTHLKYLMRVIGTDAQAYTAIHNIFSKSHG